MYSVFEEHLKTDMGMTLVRKYENTNDAQSIYVELSEHMKNSAAGTITASALLQQITGTQMHNAKWSGTRRAFVLAWNDKIREYNGLVDPSQQLGSAILKTMLQNMVIGIKDLNNIKLQEQFDITRGNPPLSYAKYLQLVSDACDLLDQTSMITTRTK